MLLFVCLFVAAVIITVGLWFFLTHELCHRIFFLCGLQTSIPPTGKFKAKEFRLRQSVTGQIGSNSDKSAEGPVRLIARFGHRQTIEP